MNEFSIISAWNSAAAENRQGLQKQGKTVLSEEECVRLKSAAKEFEALFLGLMLKEMRASVADSGLAGNGLGQTTYTEMFDQEVARSLAERGALGIADLLMRKLSNPAPSPDDGEDAMSTGSEKRVPAPVLEVPDNNR